MKKLDITQLRIKFKEKLFESGWLRVLEGFIDSEAFDTLVTDLYDKSTKGEITPAFKQIFRAFYECPYDELKVVLVGQDPYVEDGVADGLAFSCGNIDRVEPYLKVIFEEIQDHVYTNDGWYIWDPDLTRWAKQGVLLYNVSLTTKPYKFGAHSKLWEPFTKYLFTRLADLNNGMVYMFIGASAKDWAKVIPETNHKLYCYHPSSACHDGKEWESNDVFIRANEIIKAANGVKIIW